MAAFVSAEACYLEMTQNLRAYEIQHYEHGFWPRRVVCMKIGDMFVSVKVM